MNIRAWIYNSKHTKLSSDPQNPLKIQVWYMLVTLAQEAVSCEQS